MSVHLARVALAFEEQYARNEYLLVCVQGKESVCVFVCQRKLNGYYVLCGV